MLNESDNKYPLRHLSIRVPWHDNGWDGTVCAAPKLNSACLNLQNIALQRDEELEESVAGQSIADLPEKHYPSCVTERGSFMAPFEFIRHTNHPYKKTNPEGPHGHFGSTVVRHPPYSAPALPFRWMLSKNSEELAEEHQIVVNDELEPDLGFKTNWVQELRNQKALTDCFFEHIRREESLCFFYAKQVPFVESSGRILIGVGRVLDVGNAIEYEYERKGDLRALLWERLVQHSIRPDFKDGFLLPYHAALELASENPEFDPASIAATAPDDRWIEFSYASEHVTHDGALAALLALDGSLRRARNSLEGPWDQCLSWLDQRIGELWKLRGPCPGLGAALSAFGVEHGVFIAREIAMQLGDNEDPWPLVDSVFQDPSKHLSREGARQIGRTLRQTWARLPKERRSLLKLLGRFEITGEQAKCLYVPEEREDMGIHCEDAELLKNPYRLFESTRMGRDPISFWTVDRGVFPDEVVRNLHPLPEPSALDAGTDERRIRALVVQQLEAAAGGGHTLLSRKDVIRQIRDLDIRPGCEVNSDILGVAEDSFATEIEKTPMADGSEAYQLERLSKMNEIIRRSIRKRVAGKRMKVDQDWRSLLDNHLETAAGEDPLEEQARTEKSASLKELAESRFSVLVGPAGTGKTLVLSALCSQPDIGEEGVLLLAPTGKARVRMEQATKSLGFRGLTIAQFLSRIDRYDGMTGQYRLSERPPEDVARTLIIDEASMLTEEMLAALLDGIKGVHRLILVGDPRQLPPIGAGRPFVDIVTELTPDNIEGSFPRVGKGYAELTIRRRQAGQVREDLQLADWFSGTALEPGEDEVFETVVKTGASHHVRFVRWDTQEEIPEKITGVLCEELGFNGPGDIRGFDLSLGGVEKGDYRYFNRGNSHFAEKWQILSPVKGFAFGVNQINHQIHKVFRARTVEFARTRRRKIPKPMGSQEIVYGDKVINVRNHRRKSFYPPNEQAGYVANGEIGVVVGQFKTRNMRRAPWAIQVGFSSQPEIQYDYVDRDFAEEGDSFLELAYALTVHKAQGSEFEIVLLVLPNPCRLLSRELLYTALTRQKEKVVILHQGDRSELRRYSSACWSETARRLTNLFQPPNPIEIEGRFYEANLIHRTSKDELVRSKSEVIVADRLAALNVEYSYEKKLTLNGESRYPDHG